MTAILRGERGVPLLHRRGRAERASALLKDFRQTILRVLGEPTSARRDMGEAQHWWASIARSVVADFEWTWEDFVDRFDRKFFPEHVRQQRALEFEILVQGDMTVSQYEARFVALSRFATYLVDDEGRKARRFENGLRPALRSRVIGHMLPTFEQIVERAQIYESDWASLQRARDQRGDQKRKVPSGSSHKQHCLQQ
ncbi:uncharacterized protein LOC131219959 [Magnolia sinica]|uniref:uncharacterized protein LOC131219959 n=1 Tax=Magnolia sinica TaxID=86752 RepID=UPI00265B2A67|nr:uncharacterized protein LOC131219959 [Magnolia sinica]